MGALGVVAVGQNVVRAVMIKQLLKWIGDIFTSMFTPPPPERGFCYWCHKDHCPFPTFEACRDHRLQCEYHPEVKNGAPSFCHHCSYGWDSPDTWTKPTIYKPNTNKADTRWCLDWICEGCDRRDAERIDLWNRQNQDTVEAAELSFDKESDGFLYYGQPLKADFPLSYESLAPFVKRIHKIASPSLEGGIEWDYISIREGCVYIHDFDNREYPEWGDGI